VLQRGVRLAENAKHEQTRFRLVILNVTYIRATKRVVALVLIS